MLDAYLADDTAHAHESKLINSSDASYLGDKFIVVRSSPGIAGGVWIGFLFCNKPEKLFTAWIYNSYEMRFFSARTLSGC